MGNRMSTFVGWVIVFFLSTLEKFKEFFQKPKKQKDFFSNHEIILHDDENQVEPLSNDAIKKMINSQHKFKQNNEYKLVKNHLVMEESEGLKENEETPGLESLKNEIKDITLGLDHNNITPIHNENIEDLKKQILVESND